GGATRGLQQAWPTFQHFGGDMSDASGSAAPAPRSQGLIRSPKDFWGGVGLIALALFGIWACSDLPGMRGFAFGPGTAPRMFAYVLLALGAGIVLVGLLTDGAPLEQYTFAGPLGASLLLLVLLPLSLVIASYISLVVSAYATEEIRWVETLIWCAILTAFCAVLFPYGLNLPLQLWPRF